MKYRLLRLSLLSMLVMLFGGFSLAAILNASDEGPNYDKFQDFEAIVNNQEGTLLTSEEQVQGTAVEFGIAVNDEGKTLRVATNDPDAFATISGNYHSEHGLTNMKVTVNVNSFVEILVGQCTYSSTPIKVTNSYGVEVASATPATACWKNDHNNITKLIYSGADTGAETTLTITGIQYCPYIAVKVHHPVAERSEFRNFAAIVNNQEGTMLTAEEQVQGKAVILNIAVDDDGNTIRETDPNGSYHHVATITGNYHSEHGLTNMVCAISQPPVTGKLRILVGQCTYSSTPIKVTDLLEQELASVTPATACWKNDHNNVTEIICNSSEFPITITGMQYCPFIAVEKYEEPVEPTFPITATWDYSDADIMAATMAFSGSSEVGEVEAKEKNGLKMTVVANGVTFRNNGNNIQVRSGAVFKIPIKNAGDLITVKGYPNYSKYTIGNSTEVLTNENSYKAKASDAQAGYVAVTSMDDSNYYLSLSVTQYAPKEATTLDNEPVIATFPFNLGTEGQTATFSNADYFLNSKVTIGSNLSIKDKSTLTDAETGAQVDQTRLQPTTKLDTPDEASAVRFTITPKPGFAFTPTKVSLNVTRYGTDNGLADVTWEVAGGENIVLATGVKPERNNKNPNISKLSYNIENATAAEGAATLLLHLYSLQDGKQFGLNDIVIEGTLSGTEKELPILASFKVNGIEYAAEDVFGDLFEATLKLSKKDNMVSAENPLTDVIATNGEIGTITYEGDETACKVTIPMTAGDVQQNYVLNVIQKPDYTLSYIGVDGTTVIDTQVREEDQPIGEFAVDIATVAATKDGYKARGWFMQSYLGEKFTTDYVVTGDTKLYAVQTEVEGPSDSRKYIFNLTDKFFYAEDHEAFNPTGGVWHDKQHGWVFANGDQIELLVGKKANINFTFCQYSAADATISSSDGQSISAVTEGACGAGTLAYEGEEGKLTLTINASGSVYIHDITIFNTTTTNYDKQGDWLIVKQGDASSFLDAIEAAKGIEGAKVFLPNGTYDLGETVKTSVSGTNVSIIGQSAENTIVVNRPPLEWEGLDKADLLKTSATGLYMQDLSLKNDLPYTGNNGRAASLHDVGTQTICKNVNLLSYQDTYYSNKTGGLFYFEGGELHGTVDYLCGDGRVYFNECKIINEKRSTATISANSELYVFNNCVVENNADKYNLGRAWSNNPVCVYLNTTLLDPGKLLDTRWNPSGINCDYSVAGEYGTKNAEGTDITPASNVVTFTKNNTTLETILNAEQAATYTMEYVLGDWAATAKQEAKQLEAPAAEFANSTVTWTPANDGAIAYMIEKNGEFVGITAGSSMAVEANAESDKLTIRAANARGGFGEAKQVAYTGTSIQAINAAIERGEQVIFNLAGQRVNKATKGMYIINGKKMVVK